MAAKEVKFSRDARERMLRGVNILAAATALWPSWTIDCARTVAVVVPSPAMSLVFQATSRTSARPC
ncbi:hypothetical protein NKI12_28330 [Mesorhizobium australicum]|uniref:Uncharacterized protein n=1 Tax=Mesorhizobium australicum TaxID=536018 RepID=A0ACC6T6T6_9HYPH